MPNGDNVTVILSKFRQKGAIYSSTCLRGSIKGQMGAHKGKRKCADLRVQVRPHSLTKSGAMTITGREFTMTKLQKQGNKIANAELKRIKKQNTEAKKHKPYFITENHSFDLLPTPQQDRLEYLRKELRAERISYGELAELHSLAAYIEPNDVEVLEAAGAPQN